MSGPEPGADAPAFEAPWQAQAFAMTLALHERGVFTWPEWAAALAAAVKRHDAYYDAWVDALEGLMAANGIADVQEVESLAEAWGRAAEATPHGVPILLENDPLHKSA